MHPYPGIRVAIGRAVVYYAWTDREFSAGIKCRHCKGLSRHYYGGLQCNPVDKCIA